MEGRLADARRAAQRLVAYVTPHLNDPFMETMLPMSEQYMPTTMLVLSRFHQWRDILALPQPEAKLQATNGLWHFGRGWAFAADGSTEKAEQELQSLREIKNKISAETMINFNKAGPILSLAEKFLSAKIAEAKKQNKTAINSSRRQRKLKIVSPMMSHPRGTCPLEKRLAESFYAMVNGYWQNKPSAPT